MSTPLSPDTASRHTASRHTSSRLGAALVVAGSGAFAVVMVAAAVVAVTAGVHT